VTAGIVLAGGAARRLSGVDKPALLLGGKPLLARAIEALGEASPIVVVGPQREGFPGVEWTREAEPGSGPVAALAAGLDALGPSAGAVVVVLAADLAGVRKSTVDKVVSAIGHADGALLVDASGHRQWLIGAWRVDALRQALPERVGGASLRGMLGGLTIVEVQAEDGESLDIDTPEDLESFGGAD
jgi:molybdopterin-guanine dinucleotide biosynthesis protein A